MSTVIHTHIKQVGTSTAEAIIRQHSLLIDRPVSKGGADQGAMGGELLLAALGGCFMSTLLAAIRARDAAIQEVTIDIEGVLDGSPSRYTGIHLRVQARTQDAKLLSKLVVISERACIVANSIKDAVPLTFSVSVDSEE